MPRVTLSSMPLSVANTPLGAVLRQWLPSRRPGWAMMPPPNTALLVDVLLTTLSVLERAKVEYTVHQGSLLGAVRLGGALPWDIDADLAILGETAESAGAKLAQPLAAHGLSFELSSAEYYYTVRPRMKVSVPGVGQRSIPLFPMIEVMLLTRTKDATTGHVWYDRHDSHRMFAPGELWPMRRYDWYDSYVLGPRQADPVLERMYGAHATPDALRGFRPAPLDAETAAFWRRARPKVGESDYAAIAARAAARRAQLVRTLAGTPWYLANGVYNQLTETARRSAGGR